MTQYEWNKEKREFYAGSHRCCSVDTRKPTQCLTTFYSSQRIWFVFRPWILAKEKQIQNIYSFLWISTLSLQSSSVPSCVCAVFRREFFVCVSCTYFIIFNYKTDETTVIKYLLFGLFLLTQFNCRIIHKIWNEPSHKVRIWMEIQTKPLSIWLHFKRLIKTSFICIQNIHEYFTHCLWTNGGGVRTSCHRAAKISRIHYAWFACYWICIFNEFLRNGTINRTHLLCISWHARVYC